MKLFQLVILLSASAAFAADKYPPPAPAVPGAKNAIITAPAANITVVRNADNTITATATGEYNYDNAWQFKNIIVAFYIPVPGGGAAPCGPATIFAPEAAVAVPSKWSVSVQLPDLPNNSTVYLAATINLTKPPAQPGGPPITDTENISTVNAPATVPKRRVLAEIPK
jgi:hypothetical protein